MAKYYLGFRRTGERAIFKSKTPPNKATHGSQYVRVVGPYRLLREAQLAALTLPNKGV